MKRSISLFLTVLLCVSIFATVTTSQVVAGKDGMVACASPYAAEIGAQIIANGGNAVDAAVAVGFALGLVEPYASSLGGEGVMIIRTKDGQSIAIDFKSTAPGDLSKYKDPKNPAKWAKLPANGTLSACIPGIPYGLITALEEWGTMKLEDVLAPTIKLAREGFVISTTFAQTLSDNYKKLLDDPGEGTDIFTNEGLLYNEGEIFKNPVLADTLEILAKGGIDAFYKGEIADKIVDFYAKNGGAITKEDLAGYKAIVKEPVVGTYRGYKVITAPPPVGGVTLVEVLNILENFNLSKFSWDDPLFVHLVADSIFLGQVDKRMYLGDAPNMPVKGLLSKEYAKSMFVKIPLDKALPRKDKIDVLTMAGEPMLYENNETFLENILAKANQKSIASEVVYESPSTTHYSVVDKDGNAVSVTQTLSSFFGGGNVIPGTGFAMNNEMQNFSTYSGSPNELISGRRPLTIIVPTIVENPEGEVLMVAGSPGSSRITSTLIQIIVNVVDLKMPVALAMKTPKFTTYDTEDSLTIEGGYSKSTIDALKNYYGYKIIEKGPLDLYFGGPNIVYRYSDGTLLGIGSFRREGGASAPQW